MGEYHIETLRDGWMVVGSPKVHTSNKIYSAIVSPITPVIDRATRNIYSTDEEGSDFEAGRPKRHPKRKALKDSDDESKSSSVQGFESDSDDLNKTSTGMEHVKEGYDDNS
ncbi:hypothetical protein QAD02_013474 [Eretmocerus hayati]|uniref:Uncharacterized protein n=1 Tax=Eretmocerus hayati TaxID=131215 RepID=A0ACC2P2T5_9HYME|nr:hypothetical protein QAD02_013474 [Eretmocerus hayati]